MLKITTHELDVEQVEDQNSHVVGWIISCHHRCRRVTNFIRLRQI